jgi:hypothetical protein
MLLVFMAISRSGALAPVFAVLGVAASVLAAALFQVAPGAPSPIRGLAFVLVGAVGLFLADLKVRDGLGEVRYDAELDCPVVVGEGSHNFLWLPVRF